jgi:N6-L-threonylcarbamoyladenine synthase
MKILAIDTSCDETAVAVVENTEILSNVVWSQIKLHQEYGGVMPSVAKLAHEEHIQETIDRALKQASTPLAEIDAVAVTRGPGLAIALEVGIKAAQSLGKPLIAVNHIEGHVLSAWSESISFPAVALVDSGRHTDLIWVERIGEYRLLARSQDDSLGEALDKAARMLGLGYPGGAVLEKLAKEGSPTTYPLPLPMAGREDQASFSYSGLKAAMWRLVETQKPLTKAKICDLAASFQKMAFDHLIRVCRKTLLASPALPHDFLVGGGVTANVTLRKRLRQLGKELNMVPHFPTNKKLCGDNAAMIGLAAYFKAQRGEFAGAANLDRLPRWRIDQSNNSVSQN